MLRLTQNHRLNNLLLAFLTAVFLPEGQPITDTSLLTQVAEWKLKCEAIEKREAERREADAKKHKEEVAFLENHGEWVRRVWIIYCVCCLHA